MKYIGKAGYAAPRLKDAALKPEQYEESYLELVKIMRRMFQVCRLVHGDLSEYNLLYYKGHLWVRHPNPNPNFQVFHRTLTPTLTSCTTRGTSG
jgi:hypothetical protein